MSRPKFLYWLTEKDGRSRQVVNGVVTSLNNKKPLPNAPDGNQEISIGWERSITYWGNIRNFSLPLGFVLDGAKILRNDFYKFNIDRELYLLIKRLTYEYNGVTYKEYYKQFYKGELDFSTFEDDQGGYRVNMNIMEGGLQKKIKAAENTVYEIPFDFDAGNIQMDGMYINGNFRWTIPASESETATYIGSYLLPNDNAIPGLAIFTVTEQPLYEGPDGESLSFFAQATQDIPGVRLQMVLPNIQFVTIPSATIDLAIWNTITESYRLVIGLAAGATEGSTLVVDQTFDLLEGDKLYLQKLVNFDEGSMSLTAKSKPLASVVPAFTLYTLGRKLVEKITGDANNLDSTFLEAINIAATSGDGVRSLPGSVIKTTWAEYWKAVDTYCFAALDFVKTAGVEKILIRERPAVFNYSAPHDLGEISKLKITSAVDLMGTSIKVGHAEQQVDDTNGKFDFNGFMVFDTPVKRIAAKEINIQSNYKAGPFEIEQTRANYEGKTTTDKQSDNDTFVLAVLPDNARNNFTAETNFRADGTPFAPGEPVIYTNQIEPRIVAGMKLRITGTGVNDKDVTVKLGTVFGFGHIIIVNEPLVDYDGPATFEIVGGKYYVLDRTTLVTQLSDPDADEDTRDSVFNVPLTPKRILLKHAPFLAGSFYNYEGKLTFGSASRNRDLIAGGIVEKADVPVSSLGNPLFIPMYAEFDTISPVDLNEILEVDPNPVFSFQWKGQTYKGFLWKGGIAPNTLEEQTFKLLFTPDTDILNLIS